MTNYLKHFPGFFAQPHIRTHDKATALHFPRMRSSSRKKGTVYKSQNSAYQSEARNLSVIKLLWSDRGSPQCQYFRSSAIYLVWPKSQDAAVGVGLWRWRQSIPTIAKNFAPKMVTF
ncbi:hypothetical protein Tcan_00238 [Toxocara canis]|uniref:Uncharacterized protein n=1 Tax=Toxocara canis TaxID=6265 RepID=A0A0B2W1D6_TOXCA|nr:hypothetical protein Tcan_00238 [Toxocara canis]